MQTTIYRFKYGGHAEYGEGLAHCMAEKLGKDFFDDFRPDALVPVPLHPRREQNRGYNQAALLARPLGRIYALQTDERLLRRVRHTKAQSGLSPVERRRNMEEAFALFPRANPQGKRYVLVDDIHTTGATLDACRKVLLAHGAEAVRSLALCAAV